jgi:hypothetical protein
VTLLLLLASALLGRPQPLRAQGQQPHPIWDAKGMQENRGYFGTESWENIDTLTGNVILTFTDFSLPGDNGTSLTLQRTYNVKQGGGWEIGVAGVPMRVWNPTPANVGVDPEYPDLAYPRLSYADGRSDTTRPLPDFASQTFRSKDGAIYSYALQEGAAGDYLVRLPNGLVAHYAPAPGALLQCQPATLPVPCEPIRIMEVFLRQVTGPFGIAFDVDYRGDLPGFFGPVITGERRPQNRLLNSRS